VISVHDNEGTLDSFDGSFSVPLNVLENRDGTMTSVRVPLDRKELSFLFSIKKLWHYVLVCGWSPWNRGSLLSIKSSADSADGGGAASDLTPSVFDILSPVDRNQEKDLSVWDDDNLTVPVVYPVGIPMRAVEMAGSGKKAQTAKELSELERAAKKEKTDADALSLEEYTDLLAKTGGIAPDIDTGRSLGVAAFHAGKLKEAETYCDGVLAAKTSDPVALAYKGSLIAMRAVGATPLTAVTIVNEAYGYLDRAVRLAVSPGERFTSRLNRAYVSLSVPDEVFGKALEGAGDFLAASGELKKTGTEMPVADVAGAYCNAAICYDTAGKKAEAGTWFREAARLVQGRPDCERVRLELERRGY
jgi:tetratricopeptide (TPR) repeat protein